MQDGGVAKVGTALKFKDQARLTLPRLGDQINHAQPVAGAVQLGRDLRQLCRAPDKRAKTAGPRDIKPRRPRADRQNPPEFMRLGHALDLMFAVKRQIDTAFDLRTGGITDQTAARRGQSLNARGKVDRAADRKQLRPRTIGRGDHGDA